MSRGLIKSLAVAIDGDTKGLSKALQSVNKEIKELKTASKQMLLVTILFSETGK